MAKTGIIYIIKNDVNSKVYVGQTTLSLRERFNAHTKPSTVDGRYNYKLYNAMQTIGVHHFYPETLEDNVPISKLDEKEIYYIDKYNSYFDGYNGTRGGKGGILIIEREYQDIIDAYESGVCEHKIARKYSVSDRTISRVLRKNGIKIRENGNKYEGFERDKFIKMWYERELTIPQMAAYFNVDSSTIARHATRLNLPKRRSISRKPNKQLDIFDFIDRKQ